MFIETKIRFDPDEVPSSVLRSLPVNDKKEATQVDPSLIFKPSLKVDIELLGWKSIPIPEALQELKLFETQEN